MDPQPPLHWGYSAAAGPNAWPPAHPTAAPVGTHPGSIPGGRLSMKRHHSESDDCDDVFSEESSKEQCSSPGDVAADSCQMLSRKKRRGIIEKRRRDRINTSLTELRRLVPTAFEKQGSAKLEKAEILQMTVDHLKMLHAKGMDALAYDPHKFAMDYHNIGFRECAAEVARYLVTVEGMDIQDPLRLRLMSHLQCFAAQRELATKQATAASSPWSYGSAPSAGPSPQHYLPSGGGSGGGSHMIPPPPPPIPPPHHDTASPSMSNYDITTSSSATSSCSQTTASTTTTTAARHQEAQQQQQQQQQQQHQGTTLTPLASAASSPGLGYASSQHHHHHQYHMNLNSFPATGSTHHHINQNPFNTGGTAAQMKPYRPWGAEVAY